MARSPRDFAAEIPVHLVQRGNNRASCFVDDADRHVYLAILGDVSSKTGCLIHAYVLMTNHVHLLVTPSTSAAPSTLMQRLGMRYATYVNRRHQRTGTLWEGRFRSSVVSTDAYVLACHRYIELNPVRAGMVDRPEQYRWSSHLANIGLAAAGFLVTHATLADLGRSPALAARHYRTLFDLPIDEGVVANLRQAYRGQIRI